MRYFRKKKDHYVSPCDQLMHSVRQAQGEPTETQRLEREKHDAIFEARDHSKPDEKVATDPFSALDEPADNND